MKTLLSPLTVLTLTTRSGPTKFNRGQLNRAPTSNIWSHDLMWLPEHILPWLRKSSHVHLYLAIRGVNKSSLLVNFLCSAHIG